MSEPGGFWRSRLAAPAVGALMVACCLAGPIVIGAAGALTAGALFGLAAGAIGLVAACVLAARRLRSHAGKGC